MTEALQTAINLDIKRDICGGRFGCERTRYNGSESSFLKLLPQLISEVSLTTLFAPATWFQGRCLAPALSSVSTNDKESYALISSEKVIIYSHSCIFVIKI
jgi:hypothetical protein